MSAITERPQTILIVEDNDDDFECTYDALCESGNLRNPIHRASTGQGALDYLLHQGDFSDKFAHPRPGLILLDLNLPGINGKSILKVVRDSDTLKHIPVIVFTTSNDPMDIHQCYALGANSYIQKPTTLDKLVNSIQAVKNYWFEITMLPMHTD